jgi:hypothetical protein
MPGDPLLSRRAALKLTAVGGAGLVAACTGGTDPATPKLDVGTTLPERPPLPGRPATCG